MYKTDVEKKMTKREHNINLLFKAIQEEKMKNKSISHRFYKATGIVNGNNEEGDKKTYKEMVAEEIGNIKNKKEAIKEEERKEKMEGEKQVSSMRKIVVIVFGGYLLSTILFFWMKNKRDKMSRESEKEMKDMVRSSRVASYVYLNGDK